MMMVDLTKPVSRNHFFRLRSIKARFILYFIILSLVPLVLLAYFSYRTYLGVLQSNVHSYTSEVMDRIERNLQIYMSDLEQMLELRGDYYNLQFIKLSSANDIEGNRKYTFRLWENLNNLRQIKTDLRNVSITTQGGVRIGCYGVTHVDLTQNELFQNLINRPTKEDTPVFWGPHPDDDMGGSVFSVGQAIRGDYDNILGIMSIDVEMGLLDRICNDIRLGKTGYVMLVDGNGRIIYHPKAELIGKPVSFLLGKPLSNEWETSPLASQIGHGNQAVTKNFAMANWKIIGVSNQAELAREMQKATGLTLALIICSIFVVIVVALFLANLLTRPIKELQLSMRLASEDLNTNVVVRTNDEIGQLGEAFNQMLARIRQLMEQGVQEQKKLRRTEMIALQEQIKPHFIYNTLDLIIGLLETNKNEDVIKMVEALGAFFRISLSHGQEFITIRDEVEHIRNYLYLQRFRHGEKYDYRLEVDAWLLERKTIKLILQPLVENAIYHGVRELERQDGLISVKGYHSEGQAYFEVIDNGLGMSPEKVEEINNLLHGNVVYAGEQRYFGLRNVNERIVLAFGKEYGLSITSTLGRGTRVVVHLPLI